MKFINPYKLFFGAMVPNWLHERTEVSQGAKLTYARLVQYAGKHGEAFPARETLADKLGVTARQLYRYIKELEGLGLLAVERPGLGKTDRYRFPRHDWMSDSQRTDMSAQDRTNPSGQDRPDVSSPISNVLIESGEENHLNNAYHRTHPQQGKRQKPNHADPAFEQFYSAYPRKVARTKAQFAWLTLKPSPELVAQIMAGVGRYVEQVRGKDTEYIAHPATWLNGRRWEDEPAPAKANGAYAAVKPTEGKYAQFQ